MHILQPCIPYTTWYLFISIPKDVRRSRLSLCSYSITSVIVASCTLAQMSLAYVEVVVVLIKYSYSHQAADRWSCQLAQISLPGTTDCLCHMSSVPHLNKKKLNQLAEPTDVWVKGRTQPRFFCLVRAFHSKNREFTKQMRCEAS